MRSSLRAFVLGTALAVLLAMSLAAQAAPTKATCSNVLDIVVHGHHVVADYVFGVGHDVMVDWPPAGQFNAAGGAALPGGPGPGYHFPNDVPPGASFCTDSRSGGR